MQCKQQQPDIQTGKVKNIEDLFVLLRLIKSLNMIINVCVSMMILGAQGWVVDQIERGCKVKKVKRTWGGGKGGLSPAGCH